jgi:GntR family transcriptional regulator, arabinose operon transcriptional repressor
VQVLLKESPVPLYWQIKEVLEGDIRQGKYAVGSVVATEDALIKRFGVSRMTAIKALNALQEAGYVERRRRKGTVLISTSGKEQALSNVLLLMQTEGHTFHPFLVRLMELVSRTGRGVVSYDFEASGFEERYKEYLEAPPEYTVIRGLSVFPFHLLEEKARDTHLIFVMHYEHPRRYPGSYVLVDWNGGREAQFEHLLECGYDRILYVNPFLDNEEAQHITELVRDQGISKFEMCQHSNTDPRDEAAARIGQCLERLGKNTGVICGYDFLALSVYDAARDLGWEIPGDIGIIGHNDTPWTDAFAPKLSSLCLQEDLMAQYVADIVADGQDRDILIQPGLKPRGSTRKMDR